MVTLWSPFWANAKYPVKPLEDPKGSLGEAENMHWLARTGFTNDYPEVASWLGEFTLDAEGYNTLEDLVVNKYGADKEDEAVQEWLSSEENAAQVPELPER